MTGTTIRMLRCGVDRTLDGYIFTDRAHARLWLSQAFCKGADIRLEEVELGPIMRCARCGGTGHRQDVKRGRSLTLDEVLRP